MIPSSNNSSNGTVVDICSDYLCGLCPYDLLKNTSASQGSCSKVHSDETRQIYIESLSSSPQISVTNEHLRSLEGFIAARDLKVKKAKLWLSSPLEDTDEAKKTKDQIDRLEFEISKYELRRDNSHQDHLPQRERIKNQSNLCERLLRSLGTRSSMMEQQVKICEVCGCYIDQDLSGERKSLHEKPEGIHDAYIKITAKIAEIKHLE